MADKNGIRHHQLWISGRITHCVHAFRRKRWLYICTLSYLCHLLQHVLIMINTEVLVNITVERRNRGGHCEGQMSRIHSLVFYSFIHRLMTCLSVLTIKIAVNKFTSLLQGIAVQCLESRSQMKEIPSLCWNIGPSVSFNSLKSLSAGAQRAARGKAKSEGGNQSFLWSAKQTHTHTHTQH